MRSLLVLAFVIAGCSKSATDDLAAFHPQLEQIRTKLSGYTTTLPKLEPMTPAKPEPPLVLGQQDGMGHTPRDNTEVFDFEELGKPGAFGWWQHGVLVQVLKWEKEPPKKVSQTVRDEFEQAAKTRYAIVVRKTGFVAPKIEAAGYTPGSLSARVYVVDLTTDKPVAVFDASTQTPAELEVKYKTHKFDSSESKARSETTALKGELAQSLLTGLRVEIEKSLAPLGQVKLSENPTTTVL